MLFGQLAIGHVGDGHVLEHFSQVGAQRDPHLLQRLGRADVLDLLGALPAHSHERSLDRADDLREVDLVGGLGQPVAAFGPALAAHDAGGAQLREDVLQKGDRDPLGLRDVVDLARRVLRAVGQLDDRANGVIGLRCHVHWLILPETAADGVREGNPDLCGRN